ncbi:MAG: MmgE/PrpD family protein [Betaproteobacteria bacterium]|nr:MmgE/PrpD family protein [Betaproteobacteria bacterium]
MTLARELVQALRATARQPLPDDVARAAALHFVDALGVGLAAAGSSVGAAYREAGRQLANGGPATAFGMTAGAATADAALLNGGLMHSLEFDDTHTASIMHGSSVIAAAALAAGEAQGASGAALLGAYARGWEVLVRFGLAAPGRFHAQGFQATSVAGTLAAALVAADLAGLTEDQSVAALGIALSQSSGVMEFLSNGSSVKSLHSGWAAHGGVLAAMLARAGMTGPETSLEGRWGLFRQFADDEAAAERMRALIGDLGSKWHLPDAAFKFYPCCHYLHPFIEAAGILAERGVRAAGVKAIVCEVPAGAAPVICEPWERALEPATGHAARWSLPIVVAARLVEGKVDLATFEQPASPEVRDLAKRIRWVPLQNARFPERFEAVITCDMAAGASQTVRIDDVDGNHTRPPAPGRVMEKFRANAARALAPGAVDALAQAAQGLASAPDLKVLSRTLRQVKAA